MIKLQNESVCYGCGVCEIACRKKVFKIELNEHGFFGPCVDSSKCNNCGLCDRICSFTNRIDDFISPLQSYSFSAQDPNLKQMSTSGGFVSSLSKLLLEDGYNIVGVKYDYDRNIAIHDVASNLDETLVFFGSKYIQSYTVEALEKVFHSKDSNKKFAIFGTPCQIASIRKLAKLLKLEKNHVYIDLFCHGTPSYWLWNKYLIYIKSKFSIKQFESIKFRDKKFGWHDFTMGFYSSGNHYYSSLNNGDLFYQFFLFNTCLNQVCYEDCKFKYTNSLADIRIGDLWGEKYKDRTDGVSGALAYTSQGKMYCEALVNYGELNVEHLDTVTESQLKSKIPKPPNWGKLIHDLNSNKSLNYLKIKYISPLQLKNLLKRIKNKILRILSNDN